MSIENAIFSGDVTQVRQAIHGMEKAQIAPLFLYATLFEQEEIASLFLRHRPDCIGQKALEEALKSAAAHNEASLITELLLYCGEKLSPALLLEALQMAVANGFIPVINAIARDERIGAVINSEDEDHPHLIMLAVDQGDVPVLEKILALPRIKIALHHVAYAALRKKYMMEDMLKLHKTQQHIEEDFEQNILQYEKDQCVIGPHLAAELQRRKRLYKKKILSRYNSH